MKKLRRTAAETYRGADEHLNTSLTVSEHQVVAVSAEKAKELLEEGGWEDTGKPAPKPPPPALPKTPSP